MLYVLKSGPIVTHFSKLISILTVNSFMAAGLVCVTTARTLSFMYSDRISNTQKTPDLMIVTFTKVNMGTMLLLLSTAP